LPAYARFLPEDSASVVDLSPDQTAGREPGATAIPPSQATPTPETPDAPTLAATGAIARVTVDSANCRAKPRGNADRITILYRDQEVEIVGRNEEVNNPWWYIKVPDSNDNCWLWGMTASMTGTVEEIPIVK
jgi:hypothetical protein